MKVVLDTNIVFSVILNSQSWIGQIILYSDKLIKFYSPKYLQIEIQNHFQKIKKTTKLTDKELNELIEILYSKIHFISEEFIPKETLIIADQLTYDVDYDDVMFVALAIHLKCKLWTGGIKLTNSLKQKGFKKFISTSELKEKLKN
ncbi:MAG: PIN domain-containing protein [Salinivirgaceae bacterium]|nr:PIN domain-containing protein [Salinivirgaceae bacterium]